MAGTPGMHSPEWKDAQSKLAREWWQRNFDRTLQGDPKRGLGHLDRGKHCTFEESFRRVRDPARRNFADCTSHPRTPPPRRPMSSREEAKHIDTGHAAV